MEFGFENCVGTLFIAVTKNMRGFIHTRRSQKGPMGPFSPLT